MRKKDLRRSGKIAVGFFAFLLLSVLLPANCLAACSAGTVPEVIYAGDGTTSEVQTLNAANLDTFRNLMPGESTAHQDIQVENKSAQNMNVYFQAQPSDSTTAKLLDALQLKVTFKMADGSEKTLYSGPASGKNGTSQQSDFPKKDIVTSPVRLGYVYGNSTSGIISASLAAPETMTDEYENTQANLKWTLEFENIPAESIGNESTPLAPPGSGKIPNAGVPLSNPPKTGQSSLLPVFIVGGAALLLLLVILIRRRKTE